MLQKFKSKSIINLFVRGISLSLKFLFLFFLGKVSADEVNLGIYGIFEASIRLLIYLVGFDYYNYTNRKLISEKSQVHYYLKNQLMFHLVLYIFVLPFFVFQIFQWNFLSWEYFYVFCVILVFEHLNQEIFRVLSILKKPIQANIGLLIKSLWIPFVICHYYTVTRIVDIHFYFVVWSIFNVFGLIASLFYVEKVASIRKIISSKYNHAEIWAGIKVSTVFFLSSISFKIIQFSDRYVIDFFLGKKFSGVFSTYSGIAGTLEILTLNLVTIIYLPFIMECHDKDENSFSEIMKTYNRKIIIVSILGTILIGVFGYPAFLFLEKEMLLDNILVFYVLLFGSFLFNLSSMAHIFLYVKGKEKSILVSTLVPAVFNVGLNIILIPLAGIMGAAFTAVLSYLAIFLLKTHYSRKERAFIKN